MDTYDFVQLAMLAVDGEIKGKTKLQKTIYFLGLMTGTLDELGYRPHFYGPYSGEVADAVNRLKSVGFVCQNITAGGGIDKFGFEVCRYDYRFTEHGREIAEAKKGMYPELWEQMCKAREQLRDAGDLDYVLLSIAAKTYFMLSEKTVQTTEAELSKVADTFGWTVTEDQIKRAARYLSELGLVKLLNNRH